MGHGPALPDRTDVLIVGAGIIGSATAFWLSRRTDLDVTVVDKEHVGAGATGDSSAILRHVYGDRELYSRMAWWGHEFYRNFEEETGYELSVVDQPLVSWIRESEERADHRTNTYETMRRLGYPVSKHDASELPTRFPLFEFPPEIDHAISDDAAGYTDGTDAANGLMKAASDRGVRLVTDVTVESLTTSQGRITGAETDAGSVECEELVLAAGSWTHKLAATVDVDVPVTPGREQVLLLDPPDDVSQAEFDTIPTTGWESSAPDGVWWYFRADFGDTIYMATHARNDPVDPDAYSRQPDERRKVEASEILAEFAPKLADSRIIGEFCGVYANTPDQGFIIDQVGPQGLYVLVGAGHALKHGPVIGHLAADLVLDGTSALFDLSHFSIDRFEDRSPNQPLPETYEQSELHMSLSGMDES